MPLGYHLRGARFFPSLPQSSSTPAGGRSGDASRALLPLTPSAPAVVPSAPFPLSFRVVGSITYLSLLSTQFPGQARGADPGPRASEQVVQSRTRPAQLTQTTVPTSSGRLAPQHCRSHQDRLFGVESWRSLGIRRMIGTLTGYPRGLDGS